MGLGFSVSSCGFRVWTCGSSQQAQQAVVKVGVPILYACRIASVRNACVSSNVGSGMGDNCSTWGVIPDPFSLGSVQPSNSRLVICAAEVSQLLQNDVPELRQPHISEKRQPTVRAIGFRTRIDGLSFPSKLLTATASSRRVQKPCIKELLSGIVSRESSANGMLGFLLQCRLLQCR